MQVLGVFRVLETLSDQTSCIRGRATTISLVLEETEQTTRKRAVEAGKHELQVECRAIWRERKHRRQYPSAWRSIESNALMPNALTQYCYCDEVASVMFSTSLSPITSERMSSLGPSCLQLEAPDDPADPEVNGFERRDRTLLMEDILKSLVFKDSYTVHEKQERDGNLLGPLAFSYAAESGITGDKHPFLEKEPESKPRTQEQDANRWKGKGLGAADKRLRVCSIYFTEGRLLSTAESPAQVVRTVLHAVIGHWDLFTKGSRVHRDVSVGNVLIVDPFKCERPKHLPAANDNLAGDESLCQGVLIDVDLARRFPYSNDAKSDASDLSGTVPFMSRRSLRARRGMMPGFARSPCDDLESFLWVTLWNVLEKAENTKRVLPRSEASVFRDLRSLAIPMVERGKSDVHNACCAGEQEFVMKEMLDEWFEFLDKTTKSKRTEWPAIYDDFLAIGFRHLKENEGGLWSSWDVFFDRYAEPST